MLILGLETSCDETAVALVEDGRLLRANLIASQVKLHEEFGGVVPELASRNHLRALNPMLEQALHEAGVDLAQIDGIAVTQGPGLVGSLLVGVSTAKTLAYVCQKPLVGVNHIEGHLYANFLEHPDIEFPFLGVVLSGGHTSLIRVEDHQRYTILGETRDDAVGEAFDKVAKLLGLGYPGGPALEKLARAGDADRYNLPKSRFKNGCQLDFSFSGLKTAVLTITKQNPAFSPADLAASFQAAAAATLVEKISLALQQENLKTLVIGGGVIANQYLREKLTGLMEKLAGRIYYPSPLLCTDNAAMIAVLGYYRLRSGFRDDLTLNAYASLPLEASYAS